MGISITQWLAAFWILLVWPLLLGYGVCRKLRVHGPGVCLWDYIFGMAAMWAVFQVLAVPLILMRQNYLILFWLWVAALFLLTVFFLFSLRGEGIPRGGAIFSSLRGKLAGLSWGVWILAAILLLLICAQALIYVFGLHLDEDDSRFVANAVIAWEKHTMLIENPATGKVMDFFVGEQAKDAASPWPIFLAALSTFTSTHPATLAHTVLPVFLILLAYSVYWEMACLLYMGDTAKRLVFLIAVAALQIFGKTSIYTASVFLLTRIWQGKAVVAGVMLPLQFCLAWRQQGKDDKKGMFAAFFLVNLAMCLLSGMGIAIGALLTLFFAAYLALIKKDGRYLVTLAASCLPNLLCAAVYYFI